MNFKETLSEKTVRTEDVLTHYLPEEQGFQKKVIEAMNYSILAGGKRLRPMLMMETWRMFGGMGELVEPFMAAIEMIHNYSLVHDDLPAMDNDEYRRGRKTTHVVYGEGMAVLAGDGLLNYAFETACLAFDKAQGPEEYKQVARALRVLGRKAGIYGMIGGQCADIESEEHPENVTEELLLFIHEHKTAALIQCAMMIGAILAGADEEQVAAIEKCAYNIGIAFQIQDDILDVTG
ncbi:MAG: polyprenyl synthetase family protein, partial [Lachnospiraceae bacterium]|nr:polyprenyl synthetase family protein [Lachnospiraceae bacterium]